jgi:tetratricopeptide (TPR) repeat protein
MAIRVRPERASRFVRRGALSGCALALLVATGRASAADGDATVVARQHFERGYAAAQRGELELAVTEFERAYAASPNPSVLFNLGQAYASAGRPAEAVETLERYLKLAGDSIPSDRRALVNELIAYHSRTLGEIMLDVSPPGAEVTLDDRSLGAAPFARPVRVIRGRHTVVVSKSGYERHVDSLAVDAGARLSFQFTLEPIPPSARLRVSCVLPDVAVAIDGRTVGRTPLRALAAIPGAHELELSRPGYVTLRRTLTLRAGEDAETPCELRPAPKTSAFARLVLNHPAGTSAWLDGQSFEGQAVPAGRHHLLVAGPGFERTESAVNLAPGVVSEVTILPSPAGAAASEELTERKRTQRIVAYAAGGAGLALGATAIALFVYNNRAYADWQKESDEFTRDYAEDPALAPPERLDALLADERAIRNRDALAVGAGVLGGALLAAGVVLYVTARPTEPTLKVTGDVALGRDSLPLPRVWLTGAF